jgi:hypothetical protein
MLLGTLLFLKAFTFFFEGVLKAFTTIADMHGVHAVFELELNWAKRKLNRLSLVRPGPARPSATLPGKRAARGGHCCRMGRLC